MIKNISLFIFQCCCAISLLFTIIHEGLCLFHPEQNTICQWVHTQTEGSGACKPHVQTQWICVDIFLCSRLKVMVPCDSAWPCNSCCTLCSHQRLCCLSFLSHNLQMLPLPPWPPRAQPVNRHTPPEPYCRAARGKDWKWRGYKNGRKGKRKIRGEMREAGEGLWSKRQKTIWSCKNGGETGKALQIERPPLLICTVFITSEGRHPHIAFHSLPHPWLQVKRKGNFPSAHVQAAPFLMDKLYFWIV